MRTLAFVVPIALLCLAVGFYSGSAWRERERVAGAQAALVRSSAALSVGRRDEALQYAFAALDRDPELYAAYEVAGDAVDVQQRAELPRHFYRAALGHAGSPERARIQAKLDALQE